MPFFLFLSVTEGLKNYYMLGKMQLMTVFFFFFFLFRCSWMKISESILCLTPHSS